MSREPPAGQGAAQERITSLEAARKAGIIDVAARSPIQRARRADDLVMPTPSAEVTTIAACRACGVEPLVPVLSLGLSPLANALVPPDAIERSEPRYPLDVVRCPACSLVQLSISIAPEMLFRDYVYLSSVSDGFVAHARALVERVVRMHDWGRAPLAVEIASNDGYLLQHYRAHGIPTLGIEPARNIAAIARRQRGIETIEEFFGCELAARLVAQGRRADVIHANNVLAHVPDLNGVLAGMRLLLNPEGMAIVEVPSLRDTMERVEFDTIYHEHLCYFSLTALMRAFARQGLTVVDVEHLSVHGGSLRVFARRSDTPASSDAPAAARVAAMLATEQAWGVDEPQRYDRFQGEVGRLKRRLLDLVGDLKAQGRSIAAYGASAKGTTLLNYCGLGADDIAYVVDRNPVKQGQLTPGTRIAIHPTQKLLDAMPDYVMLLAWNLADEVIAQQAEYRRRGGRFIVPLPEPRIV
jgi:C-methyltransferase C-terminal domain/Putative zinc binding domain/Methyltransferase domain